MTTQHLVFPDRSIGSVALLGHGSVERVEARGTVAVPVGTSAVMVTGEEPVEAGDLSALASTAVARAVVTGAHADAVLASMAASGSWPRELLLGSGVTDAGLVELATVGPRLETLVLESPLVTERGMEAVSHVTALRSLVLGVRRVRRAGEPPYVPPAVGLRAVAGSRSLEELVVGVAHLDHEDLAVLAGLPALRLLHVTAAAVPGWVIAELSLRRLVSLRIKTALDDTALRTLATVPTLRDLSFDASEATASAVLDLRAALPDVVVNGEWLAPRAVARLRAMAAVR